MSLVVGPSFVKSLNWLAAHSRNHRRDQQILLDVAHKKKQQMHTGLQSNSDKAKPPITDDLPTNPNVLKQPNTDEIKLTNAETDFDE